MPFILVTIGLLAFVTAIKGTYKQFGSQVVSDLTGAGGYLWWILAIFAVGAIGYIPQIQKFSRAFLALIILGMILANKGFFAQLTTAIQSGPKSPTGSTNSVAQTNVGNTSSTTSASNIPGTNVSLATASQAAQTALKDGSTALAVASAL